MLHKVTARGLWWLLPALALAGLSACSTVNPVTLAQMARLDPMTVPPGNVAVRLALPQGLKVAPGGALLELSVANQKSGETLTGRFELAETNQVWALTPQDATRLEALQARTRSWPDDDREGTLAVTVTGCRIGDGPSPGAVINIDISFDAGGSFAPLVRNLSAEEVIGTAGAGPQQGGHISDSGAQGAGCLGL